MPPTIPSGPTALAGAFAAAPAATPAGSVLLALAGAVGLTAALLSARAQRPGIPGPGRLTALGALCGGSGLALGVLLGVFGGDRHGVAELAPLALGVAAGSALLAVGLLRLACSDDRADLHRCLLDGVLVGSTGFYVLWELVIEPEHREYLASLRPTTAMGGCLLLAVPTLSALFALGVSIVLMARTGPGRALVLPAASAVGAVALLGVAVVATARYAALPLFLLAAVAYAASLLVLGWLTAILVGLPHPGPELPRRPELVTGVVAVVVAVLSSLARRVYFGPIDVVGVITLCVLAMVASLRQVAVVVQLRQFLREYRHQAHTDPLTGLPNRRRLLELIARSPQPATLLLIDLDGFKSVNDIRGHDCGDLVLGEVARRLRDGLPPGGAAARLGGDEFAVLLPSPLAEAAPVAERLRAALAEPYDIGGAEVYVSGSVGVAGCHEPADADRVLVNADVALRFAKRRGKNRVEGYAVADELWLRRRNLVEQELRGAAGRGELSLVFQPVMRLPSGQPVGVEALLRWNHPELGAVPPDEFIPIAEDAGLVGVLDRWVLDQACGQLAEWVAGGYELWVAVNISVFDLQQPHYVRRVLELLRDHDLPASLLVLEVTEHAVALDPAEVSLRLSELRALGVRVALDDFGAGYSSLGQLLTLPVDILKIDRALLVEPLLDVSVQLGHRLGKLVIAEGIADAQSRAAVERTACGLGQGSALCPPVPAATVTELLTAARGVPGQRRAQNVGQVDGPHEMRQS